MHKQKLMNNSCDVNQSLKTLIIELMEYAVKDENYEAAIILRDYLNDNDDFKSKT